MGHHRCVDFWLTSAPQPVEAYMDRAGRGGRRSRQGLRLPRHGVCCQGRRQPPLSIAMTKLTVNRLAGALDDLASHMDLDQFALASITEDHKEGVAAFLGAPQAAAQGSASERAAVHRPPSRHIWNSHKVYYGIFICTIRSDIYADLLANQGQLRRLSGGRPGVWPRGNPDPPKPCCRRLRTLQ